MTQQRYKRNPDANVDTRNRGIRAGDFVHATNHQQNNKMRRRTVRPFVEVGADDFTNVVDVNGQERRVNSDILIPCRTAIDAGRNSTPIAGRNRRARKHPTGTRRIRH